MLVSMFNDVLILCWDVGVGFDWWLKNLLLQYVGLICLCQGLGQLKNVVMVCVMCVMGVDYVVEYLQCFGFLVQNIVYMELLVLGLVFFMFLQVVCGYLVMVNGGFLVNFFFISKIENDQGGVFFEECLKIVCLQCDLLVIYGDMLKFNVLENKDVEDVVIFVELQNGNVLLQLQLEQVNQLLVVQSGVQEYVLYVINILLVFLIKSVLNSNIFGELGWMGIGWCVGCDLQWYDIGGKIGIINSLKDVWFLGYGLGVVILVWIGFDDYCCDFGWIIVFGVIKDQIFGYEGGVKSVQLVWDSFMKSVLEGVLEELLILLLGIVMVNIDCSIGQLVNGGNSWVEYFIEGIQFIQQVVCEVGIILIDGGGEIYELF